MSIIASKIPDIEIYSIDEAFLDLSNMQNFDVFKICADLLLEIKKCTGVPVSIGIANSKTLAKVAAHVAKKQAQYNGVFNLDSVTQINSVLSNLPVRDIWGIGRQLEKKLQTIGVVTAGDLVSLPEVMLKKTFNSAVQRTVQELKGLACIKLKDNIFNKKQIMVSRSFGDRVATIDKLNEALSTYASMACEKLRKQNSVAGGLYVFLHTGLHGATETIYKNSAYIQLPTPSFDSRYIVQQAKYGLNTLFRAGYRYKKVGIILCDLQSAEHLQIDLFENVDLSRSQNLMTVIDQLNQKLGRDTVQFAAAGLDKTWKMKNTHKSQNYTGDWNELLMVEL